MVLITSRLAVEDMFLLMMKGVFVQQCCFFPRVYSSQRLQDCQMNREDSDETKGKTLIRHNYVYVFKSREVCNRMHKTKEELDQSYFIIGPHTSILYGSIA